VANQALEAIDWVAEAWLTRTRACHLSLPDTGQFVSGIYQQKKNHMTCVTVASCLLDIPKINSWWPTSKNFPLLRFMWFWSTLLNLEKTLKLWRFCMCCYSFLDKSNKTIWEFVPLLSQIATCGYDMVRLVSYFGHPRIIVTTGNWWVRPLHFLLPAFPSVSNTHHAFNIPASFVFLHLKNFWRSLLHFCSVQSASHELFLFHFLSPKHMQCR